MDMVSKYQFVEDQNFGEHPLLLWRRPRWNSAKLLDFPGISPDGLFLLLEREPVFDPARHLALERPDRIVSLRDLGYSVE